MRIRLDFTREPEIGRMFATTVPMILIPVSFTPLRNADVIVSDGIEPIADALRRGKYAIHYCVDIEEVHPREWQQSTKYRYVQHDGGHGGPVTGHCLL
jgi:hypothetical protein